MCLAQGHTVSLAIGPIEVRIVCLTRVTHRTIRVITYVVFWTFFPRSRRQTQRASFIKRALRLSVLVCVLCKFTSAICQFANKPIGFYGIVKPGFGPALLNTTFYSPVTYFLPKMIEERQFPSWLLQPLPQPVNLTSSWTYTPISDVFSSLFRFYSWTHVLLLPLVSAVLPVDGMVE